MRELGITGLPHLRKPRFAGDSIGSSYLRESLRFALSN